MPGRRRRNRLYRKGELEREDFDCGRVDELLAEDDTVVWLHLESPDDDAGLTMLTEELGLSRRAVEELVRTGQRTKVTRHDGYLLLTVYLTRVDPVTAELTMSELGVVASARWLVTLPRVGSVDVDDLRRAWDESPDLAVHGVAFLVHRLLERAVDSHFDAVQQLDDAIDLVEAGLFTDDPHDTDAQMRSYAVRKALVGLRRVALPVREVRVADPEQPDQRGDAPAQRLGGDLRGVHRHHRLLRDERALPPVQQRGRRDHGRRAARRDDSRPDRLLPRQTMAVSSSRA